MTPHFIVRHLLARIEAGTNGYLAQVGWLRTRATRAAMDAAGQPVPWFTYPAIAFLAERVRKDWRVLEYGSGAGTCWWSRHCDVVVAIEHDSGWADRVAARCNARILRAPGSTGDDYVQPAEISGSEAFDVIVVDGIFRRECLAASGERLSKGGVIILDDAQRADYADAVASLVSKGFRTLPFHGPQPVSKHPSCTLVLYRDGNVLGL